MAIPGRLRARLARRTSRICRLRRLVEARGGRPVRLEEDALEFALDGKGYTLSADLDGVVSLTRSDLLCLAAPADVWPVVLAAERATARAVVGKVFTRGEVVVASFAMHSPDPSSFAAIFADAVSVIDRAEALFHEELMEVGPGRTA